MTRILPRPFSWSPGSVERHVQAACWSPALRSSASSRTLSPFAHGPQSSTGTGCGRASPPSEKQQGPMLAFEQYVALQADLT